MSQHVRINILSRRAFIASAGAALLLKPHLALAENSAASLQLERSDKFKDAFARIVGTLTPIEGKIAVDLPEIAENGNFVPITVVADSPMTDADHVTAIHLLSTANPVAHVATFRLSPINAVARVQSRIRLAKTQEFVTLASLSTGQMLIATTLVKVTIGGCAG